MAFDYQQFLLHEARRKFFREPDEQVFIIGGQKFLYAEMVYLAHELLSMVRPRDREILRMKFFDDLTENEIADRIGVVTSRVNQLTHRGLRKAKWAGLQ